MPSPSQTSQKETLNSWEIAALCCAIFILTLPFLYRINNSSGPVTAHPIELKFSGSSTCKSCHEGAYNKWLGSDHERAMLKATQDSVLGDFNNATYIDPYNKVTSRFFTKDSSFWVETEGPDGIIGTFQISHTFGIYPLQQYLVPFPDGKLQCLNIAWDIEKKRWYRLPPYDVKGPNDWLHWTRGGQTWNTMCAECHSTRLEKNFDMAAGSYDTRWFEISVGCEACHGPGSEHIRWAEQPPLARQPVKNYSLTVQSSSINADELVTICAPLPFASLSAW